MAIRDMVARHSKFEDNNDFAPTPPYVTRALYELVAPRMKAHAPRLAAYDPAAGAGDMLKVFEEYGHWGVYGGDIIAREEQRSRFTVVEENFLEVNRHFGAIVTNPPYSHINEFISHGLSLHPIHFAVLARINVLEGQARWRNIWSQMPPTRIAFFSDRIPFKMGTVVKSAPKMFFHCWLYWGRYISWDTNVLMPPKPPMWLPPDIQKRFEKESDYGTHTV